MTDRTHPDSGFPIAYSHYANYAEYVEALHARIAELEAQLESIGAGGVSGPLMGQPQAMPDLSALTERGAKAWAGVDAQGLREGFTAADMATASAQGFRDGVASVAASAPAPSEGRATPPAQAADSVLEDAVPGIDAAFEAVRRGLCKLPRYSFYIDTGGGVRKVGDRIGKWIEFDEAHALFDPISVDAARKQGANHD